MKKRKHLVGLTLILSLSFSAFALPSFSLPSLSDLVKDLYKSAINLPGGLVDAGAWAIQTLVVEPVLNNPKVQIAKYSLKFALPDRYERMVDHMFKGMDIRKALPSNNSRGTTIDTIDLLKMTIRENQIFSQAHYYSDNSSYINETLRFDIIQPGDALVKISAPLKISYIGSPAYLPLFKTYPITVNIRCAADSALIFERDATASSSGNISMVFNFNRGVIDYCDSKFKVTYDRHIDKLGSNKSVVVTTTILVPRSLPKYRVKVETSTDKKAGTDSRVWLTILGTKGDIIDQRLDNDKDNFEKGQIDTFHFSAPDLGDIKLVQIHTDDSGDGSWWKPRKITIEKLDKYADIIDSDTFYIGEWIGGRTDLYSSATGIELNQKVCVKTGSHKYAGTDSTITVRFWAKNGLMYGPVEIDGSGDDFEKNSYRCYKVKMPYIGEIERIDFFSELNGDGPGWLLNYAKYENTDLDGNTTISTFNYNSWVDENNNGFVTANGY